MFSVTYIGRCRLPLCTPNVKPTMSGVIVERRDQVLITGGRWPPERARSTAFVMPLSMDGPFLTERAIVTPLPIADCRLPIVDCPKTPIGNRQSKIGNALFGPSILQDHLLRALVAARLVSTCRLAPRGYWIAATRSLTFTTAMRMVHWIHRHAAHVGS